LYKGQKHGIQGSGLRITLMASLPVRALPPAPSEGVLNLPRVNQIHVREIW